MKSFKNLYIRFLLLLFSLFVKVQLSAQEDIEEDLDTPSTKGFVDVLSDYNDSDLITTVFVGVIACFLLFIVCHAAGRIWKGFSYLLLALVALIYYAIVY